MRGVPKGLHRLGLTAYSTRQNDDKILLVYGQWSKSIADPNDRPVTEQVLTYGRPLIWEYPDSPNANFLL